MPRLSKASPQRNKPACFPFFPLPDVSDKQGHIGCPAYQGRRVVPVGKRRWKGKKRLCHSFSRRFLSLNWKLSVVPSASNARCTCSLFLTIGPKSEIASF